jgi:hypothetical protein
MQHNDNNEAEIRRALAAYTGEVTRCPPGKPRAPSPASKPMNKAVGWLKLQPRGGRARAETPKAQRERLAAERARIAAHNEVVRKARGLRKSDIG